MLFSGCCFIYTGHLGWVVGCQAPSITWTITREIMFSCYPLCLVTAPLLPCLWIRPVRLVFSIVFIFVSSLVSTTLVGQLRLKYTRAVFMCVWRVLNGVRGVYFHFLGEKYDCLRCHCPLTCPAGWKGFLTHPSHASALQSIRGAGQTQGRLGIWISHPPHQSDCNICWKPASAVNPLNIPAGIPVLGGVIGTCVCNSVANQNIRKATWGSSAGLFRWHHLHLFPGRFRIALRTCDLHNLQSDCRWQHLKSHTSGRVEALGCRHVCIFRLLFLWVYLDRIDLEDCWELAQLSLGKAFGGVIWSDWDLVSYLLSYNGRKRRRLAPGTVQILDYEVWPFTQPQY